MRQPGTTEMNMQLSKLHEFLQQFPLAYNKEITCATSVEYDLGFTGDDAVEFIIEYSKYFKVDVSDFMAAKYFDGEGDGFIHMITQFFLPKRKEYILIVEHLVKGIMYGRLNEVVIHS